MGFLSGIVLAARDALDGITVCAEDEFLVVHCEWVFCESARAREPLRM